MFTQLAMSSYTQAENKVFAMFGAAKSINKKIQQQSSNEALCGFVVNSFVVQIYSSSVFVQRAITSKNYSSKLCSQFTHFCS